MEFKKITNKNFLEICKLEVNENQLNYVAKNIESLAEAYATINSGLVALPFGLYVENEPVGFIMIGKGTVDNDGESSIIKNNYSIWRLMIDKNKQHQGYGLMAMKKAIEMIKNDEFGLGKTEYVWLSYDEENVYAKKFYEKIGFIEINEKCDDEIIAIYKL